MPSAHARISWPRCDVGHVLPYRPGSHGHVVTSGMFYLTSDTEIALVDGVIMSKASQKRLRVRGRCRRKRPAALASASSVPQRVDDETDGSSDANIDVKLGAFFRAGPAEPGLGP